MSILKNFNIKILFKIITSFSDSSKIVEMSFRYYKKKEYLKEFLYYKKTITTKGFSLILRRQFLLYPLEQ